jgi:hypothetical protein
MDRRLAADLDNYITGHYGEDQFRDEEAPEEREAERRKIREENDAVRRSGQAMWTSGLLAFLAGDVLAIGEVLSRVARFDAFNDSNDPWGEHDCASFEFRGETLLWKIDDYGEGFREFGVPRRRILTIMLASDY